MNDEGELAVCIGCLKLISLAEWLDLDYCCEECAVKNTELAGKARIAND